MRFKHSSDPIPALVVPVDVSCSGLDIYQRAPAKIDTGADISAIPEALKAGLKLKPEGSIKAKGAFSREAQECPTYYVTLSIPRCMKVDTQVVCLSRDGCIIGRDVLNRIVMRADGPAGVFELAM